MARLAHSHNIPLVVDSTFATPYLLRPIEYGADIVVHSATKFIGGHGTSLGGVIVDSGNFDWEASGKFEHLVKPNDSYHGVSFTKAAGKAAFVTLVRAVLLRDTGAAISPLTRFCFCRAWKRSPSVWSAMWKYKEGACLFKRTSACGESQPPVSRPQAKAALRQVFSERRRLNLYV